MEQLELADTVEALRAELARAGARFSSGGRVLLEFQVAVTKGGEGRGEVLGMELGGAGSYALEGAASYNKGMALFPRRINGAYAMIGRQDGESCFFMQSDDLMRWEKGELLLTPKDPIMEHFA